MFGITEFYLTIYNLLRHGSVLCVCVCVCVFPLNYIERGNIYTGTLNLQQNKKEILDGPFEFLFSIYFLIFFVLHKCPEKCVVYVS